MAWEGRLDPAVNMSPVTQCPGTGGWQSLAAKRAEVHSKVFHNGVTSLLFWESEWLERDCLGMSPGYKGNRPSALMAEIADITSLLPREDTGVGGADVPASPLDSESLNITTRKALEKTGPRTSVYRGGN